MYFHNKTTWDALQEKLSKGGEIKLNDSLDYNSASYKYSAEIPVKDGNGKYVYDKDGEIVTRLTEVFYGELYITADTVLDLNGHTLNASRITAGGDVRSLTVKNGTLCGSVEYKSDVGSGGAARRKASRETDYDEPAFAKLTLVNATVTLSLGDLLGADNFGSALSWFGGIELINSTLDVGYGLNTWVAPLSGPMLTMDAGSSVTFKLLNLVDYFTKITGADATENLERIPEELKSFDMLFLCNGMTDADEAAALYQEQLGAFLPDGYRFVATTLDFDGGEAAAVSVVDAAGNFPESVTLRRLVSGAFNSSGELVAAVAEPANGILLIAAEYDAKGRQTNKPVKARARRRTAPA